MSFYEILLWGKEDKYQKSEKRGMGYHMQEKAIYVPGIFMFKQNLHWF